MTELAEAMDVGQLGVCQLKRLWSRAMAAREGVTHQQTDDLWLDHLVLHAVGLGLEQTLQHLMRTTPTFPEFEQWVVATTGGVSPAQTARINAVIGGGEIPIETRRLLEVIDASEPVLSEQDLAFWGQHGYVILHDAVPAGSRDAAAQATLDFLGADLSNPETWYPPNPNGIMVQLFQHPALETNRRSPRIHKAFAQLWGNADLWVTTDRVGFNAPERPGHQFRGPHLHWDTSLERPIPFGTQGILYLTDTEPEQGALTLVPGFHRRIDSWLDRLPAGADPRQQDLYALGAQPVAGRAGDLIIWHQALPHGSRPNRTQRPRIVQYVNMHPAQGDPRSAWI